MTIPHVSRTVTHVDRTVVHAAPASVFERLLALPTLLGERPDVRIEDWPTDGLAAVGAGFWAVHQRGRGGHAVEYVVREVDRPRVLHMEARSDRYRATHTVVVGPTVEDGSEVAWSVTMAPDQPASHQLLADASLLGTVAVRALTDAPAPAPAPVDATPVTA